MPALYDSLINEFEVFFPQFEKTESPLLLRKRKDAFTVFAKEKFPTTKHEEWRFTDISRFLKDDFKFNSNVKIKLSTIRKAVNQAKIENVDAYYLVLVNDVIYPQFSFLPQTDELIVKPISEIKNSSEFESIINQNIDVERFPFVSLNTSFFENGYFIKLKKDTQLDKPLQIIQVYAAKENIFLQPRHLLKVSSGADCSIIETLVCMDEKIFFINSCTEIFVEENAHLRHLNFQQGSENERRISHSQVRQAQNSYYENFTITFPEAAFVRNNLNVVLDGADAETHLYGLYVAGNQCLVDNHSLVEHRFPDCKSNQLYKGIMLDGGRGVFNGKIYVHREAQKTNAFQQNNNLLFSPNAVINSKPQLEIFADDVKCSHGTTIGQFNEEALFYLRSRGIGEEAARGLLVNAFATDVTAKIKNEALRKHIEQLVGAVIQSK